jgi:hypothetical protein
VPRSAGKDTTHRLDPRIIPGQPAAQHPWLSSLSKIPYDQHDPETIPATDLVDAAEPIEIVETVSPQRLNRGQPILRQYLGHDATRPTIWSSTTDNASGGGGQPGT